MKKVSILLILILSIFVLTSCDFFFPNQDDPQDEQDEGPNEENTYMVRFYDSEGNVIYSVTVKENESATAPTPPTKEGYIFVRWDKDYTNVTQDLDIYPIYEKEIINEYTVKFYVFGKLISEQKVKENDTAIAPEVPIIPSHSFIGWDKDFTSVKQNLSIYAIYNKTRFVSYISEFALEKMESIVDKINSISRDRAAVTLTNIFIGGPRNTNYLNYYDYTYYRTRNQYGFEVAVNEQGIVIDANTLVDIPQNGFILSGHGTRATELRNSVKIGDLVVFDFVSQTAKVYRDNTNTPLISLNVKINYIKNKIDFASTNYKAVDYELINYKLNEAIKFYNQLLDKYDYQTYQSCDQLLLDIEYLLVETRPIQTNAIWHYPLRSGTFFENSTKEVQRLLDEYQKMGINRIYLNTNFNGSSIYKSQYLNQLIANNYNYEGYKDYLECFIEEAHKRNIEVYAWTNTLIAGDGMNNKFYSDRGWLLTNYYGSSNFDNMYFVDISNSQVRDFLKNVFNELASEYNLDGIEFDFIRYPSGNLYSFSGVISESQTINDSGYTESFISAFREYYPFTGDFKTLIQTDETLRNIWLNFKTILLTNVVNELTTIIRNAKPDIKITAAIMPNITSARNVYRQDWLTWIELGYLDGIEPMIYTGATSDVISQLTNLYNLVNEQAEIVVGLFPEGSGATPGVNAEQIDKVIELFPVGWSKFSSKTILNHAFYKESYKYLYRPYIVQSSAPKEEIFYAYFLDLYEKTIGYYQYVTDASKIIQIFNSFSFDDPVDYDTILMEISQAIEEIPNDIIKVRLQQTNQYVQTLINQKW